MTYFIWSCFWSAKQTSEALQNGALQTSAAFKRGNVLTVHHHTWSHLQQPSESPLGEFLNWISAIQKSALIPLACLIFEVWRTTFRYIFLFPLDPTELSVLVLKSEPAPALSTACVGNFLPVSLQSSIKPEPGCFIQKCLLGRYTDVKPTQTLWMTDWWAVLQEKYPVFCR